MTVITPTIPGREQLLEECRDSVLGQTHPAVQHLVGVDERREGPATVRNRLVAQSQSEWILPLDDDDLLDADCVERLVAASQGADVTYSWCRMLGRTDGWVPNKLYAEYALFRQNYIPNTALIRRDMWNLIGGHRPGVHMEDWLAWITMVQHGAKFRCLPEVTWSYRHHAGQNFQKQAA